MKFKIKIKNTLPACTLLPLPLVFLTNSRGNFLVANSLSDTALLASTFTLLILYFINAIYRATYSKINQRKFVAPFCFIFTFQVLHFFILLLGILGAIEKFGIQTSSSLSIQYFISTIIILITTFHFEQTTYQKHEDNIKKILFSSSKEMFQSDIIIPATTVLLVVLLASKDASFISPNIFILSFSVWNIVFLQIIRPNLINYLKDE